MATEVITRRRSKGQSIANYVRIGEGLKQAMQSLEWVHGRMQRAFPGEDHEYREMHRRAYDDIQTLYAGLYVDFDHNFPGEPHTLSQLVGRKVQWPDDLIEELKAEADEAEEATDGEEE